MASVQKPRDAAALSQPQQRNSPRKPSSSQALAPLASPPTLGALVPTTADRRGTLQQAPTKWGQTIAALTERTRAARESLEKMTHMTAQLREQCSLQEAECAASETEKTKAKEELDNMIKRVEELVKEKTKVEHRLEELKGENDRLEGFLAESEALASNADSAPKARPNAVPKT
ncbi:hypothetical protein DFS34DRAFT_45132 [Phlyctochytrium arcticum]|nr:hypothetical protein DFS34DRAFT_45132 [Phlyctochytrium arcticum]